MLIRFQTVTACSNLEIIQQFCQNLPCFSLIKQTVWIYVRTAHVAVHVCITTIAKPKEQEYQTEVGNLQPCKRHAIEQMGVLIK